MHRQGYRWTSANLLRDREGPIPATPTRKVSGQSLRCAAPANAVRNDREWRRAAEAECRLTQEDAALELPRRRRIASCVII